MTFRPKEANEWADRSCLVRIFWDHPVPLQAVRGTLDDVWKCRGELNIFEAGFGLYQFLFPSVPKRNWVLRTQPWSFQLSIMNMIRFVTPTENLFNQLQFMDIAVKLAGIPIDCRTLAFGNLMLEKIGEVKKINFFIADSAEGFFIKGLVKLDILGSRAGRITARFPGGRSFFVYFQYIQVQAICYQCGIIGHIHDFCPHHHLTLDLEARNSWMCIPDCGKLVEGPNLQKKSTNKYQSRRGTPILPPSVMASFAAARSNNQSLRLEEVPNQVIMKERSLISASAPLALEHPGGSPNEDGTTKNIDVEKSTGPHDVVRSQETVGALNGTGIKTREAFVADDVGTEKMLKRKKVYEDKGKAKVSEFEKEPKKMLFGNKGIVIRVLDDEPTGERIPSARKDQVPNLSEEMADTDGPVEERNHKVQVPDPEKAKSTVVKELFGISGAEANKMWSDQESNEDDGSPWVSRIDTYGTNEGTIGEMLREEEGLNEEG
ncbi:hypothetical protein LINPERPRIM_LOCUS29749 [Linum perenne]